MMQGIEKEGIVDVVFGVDEFGNKLCYFSRWEVSGYFCIRFFNIKFFNFWER